MLLVIGLQKRKRSLQGVIMKDNFGKEKTLIVIGSSLILIGVLLNEWIVAALFCPDGVFFRGPGKEAEGIIFRL